MAAVSARPVWERIKHLVGGGSPRRRKHSLPVEVISPRPTPKAISSPRHTRPDPWIELWEALERQQQEFTDIERQLKEAARRDGLDDDGPMTPTLAALRLAMRNLNQNGLLIGRMLRHYMGQLLDALEARKEMTDAEVTRLRVELEHAYADRFYRMQQPAGGNAQTRSVGLTWPAVLGFGCVLAGVIVCSFIAGDRLGYGDGYSKGHGDADSSIRQTEWHLKAAFAHGGTGASIWAVLMQSNDIETAVIACRGPNLMKLKTPRKACWVPLWTEPDATVPTPEPTSQGSVTVEVPLPLPPPPPDRQQHGSAVPPQPFGSGFGLKLLPVPSPGMVNFGPDDSR